MADKPTESAALGLNLDINGLGELKQISEIMEHTRAQFAGLNDLIGNIKHDFSGLGADAAKGVGGMQESVRRVQETARSATQEVRKMGEFDLTPGADKSITSLKKMNSEFVRLPTSKVGEIAGKFGDVRKQVDESTKATQRGSHEVDHYSSSTDKATKSTHRLRDIITGSFIGMALTTGVTNLIGATKEAIKSGYELAEGGERIRKQWGDLGFSEAKAKAWTDQIGEIRGKSNIAGGAIDSMQKKFYALTNSASKAKALTNELAAFGSEAGKSGDEIAQMANQLGRSLGGKKVASGLFNRAFGSMPELKKQIVQASGMTNAAFSSALKNGKVTGTQLEGFMLKASKNSGKAWKEFSDTTAGQIDSIKGTWQNTKAAFSAPLASGVGEALKSMSKGKGGLESVKKQVVAISKALGQKSGEYVGDAIKFLVKNAKPLDRTAVALTRIVKNLAIGIWKPFATVIGKLGGQSGKAAQGLEGFSKALDSISKHQQAIQNLGKAMVGLWAASKALKGLDMAKSFGGKIMSIKTAVSDSRAAAGTKESATVFGDAFKGIKSAGRNGLKKIFDFNDAKGIFSGIKNNKSLLGGGSKNIFNGAKDLFKSGGLKAVAGSTGKGLLKTAGRGLLTASPVNAALSATELIGMNKKNAGTKVGRAGGSLAGGAAGAAIGTAILPGIGTILGGAGGTLLGTKLGGSIGKGVQKSLPKIKATLGDLFNGKLGWEKSVSKAMGKAFSGVGHFFTGKLSWEKSLGKSVGNAVKGVKKALKPLAGAFSAVFKTIGKVIKGFVTALKWTFLAPIALVVGIGIKTWQKLSGPIKKVLTPLGKFISSTFKGIKKTISGVWSWISKTTGGIWKGFKKHVTGPVKDVYSAVSSWIGKKVTHTIRGAWSGIKSVTRSTWKLVKKYVVNPVKDIFGAVKHYIIGSLVKGVKASWDTIKSATKSAWKLVKKYAINPVKSVFNTISDFMDKLKKVMGDRVDAISDKWKKTWSGISDTFSAIWKSIKKHAQEGINGVIGILNTGIGGIDSVIHAFGGSSSAIGKISTVHLATGTGAFSGQRKAITRPTLATLNDGNDSPETGNREMLVHPNGLSELVKGRNVQRILEPGAEVFNATETRDLGLATGHFKTGTEHKKGVVDELKDTVSGVTHAAGKAVKSAVGFAAGAFSSIKSKFKTIKKLISNPSGFLSGLLKVPSGNSKVLDQFAAGFYSKMKGQASDWWSTLWSMASGFLSDGGVGGGPVLHSPGSSWHVSSGFGHRPGTGGGYSDHDGVDFTGSKTVHALQDSVVKRVGGPPSGWGGDRGIGQSIATLGGKLSLIYQELNGKASSGADILVHTGQHIKQGQAIAKLGPNGTHVHIGASTQGLWSHGGGSTRGWLDVTKLTGNYGNSSKGKASVKAKGAMQKTIKSEVGGMFSWIKKYLAPLADAAGGSQGNPGGSGVQRWKPYVIKALKANHFSASDSQVSAWLRVISRESNGNPKAVNNWDSNAKAGHPSKGLVQTIEPTFNAYKFSGHGNILNGYDDLLAGIHYMAARYGRGAGAFARVSGPSGYAKGGRPKKDEWSIVGEKGWELFKPDTAGTVLSHEKSVNLLSKQTGSRQPIKIDARMSVTVKGNADKDALADLDRHVDARNDLLMDKLSEIFSV